MRWTIKDDKMINKLMTVALLFLSTLATFGQSLDCKKLKEGKFKIEDPGGSGLTIITRTGNIQREENEDYKIITEDKIEWINDCAYRLIPYKVIKNEGGLDLSTDLKLEIEFIQIKADSYIQRTTSRLTGQSLEAEVKIIRD